LALYISPCIREPSEGICTSLDPAFAVESHTISCTINSFEESVVVEVEAVLGSSLLQETRNSSKDKQDNQFNFIISVLVELEM